MDLSARFEAIRDRVARAARRSGRDPSEVRVVAVSKTRTAAEVETALSAGVTDLGENKVQEAEQKQPGVAAEATWHFVGHLQKNKAKKAVELFDVIHTVDGIGLGERLDRVAAQLGKRQRVLVQVDLAQESTKFGLPESELNETLSSLAKCEHLSVEGLMVLPPFLPDANEVRPYFARLRALAADARARGLLAGEALSMGMSHDFEVAVEEGATYVRIGTAIFGPRPSTPKGQEQVV